MSEEEQRKMYIATITDRLPVINTTLLRMIWRMVLKQ